AEDAEIHRSADAGPRSRFLGRRERAFVIAVREAVQLLQKTDRLEVLASSERVRNPLPFLARVVQIQHRRDRVHAQAVDVILLEPEQCIRQQETADFVASVVENERPPVGMLALTRIRVLVQRGAVEPREPVRVLRKMTRHPVEDDADAGLMAAIDEQLEVLGRTEARRRREEPEYLV